MLAKKSIKGSASNSSVNAALGQHAKQFNPPFLSMYRAAAKPGRGEPGIVEESALLQIVESRIRFFPGKTFL